MGIILTSRQFYHLNIPSTVSNKRELLMISTFSSGKEVCLHTHTSENSLFPEYSLSKLGLNVLA